MTDMFNGGYNLMGDLFGDEFATVEAPKKEKKEKKEKAAVAKKKASSKVTLPVTVYGGSFKVEIAGDGTETEINTERLSVLLTEAGYVEVNSSAKALYVPKDAPNVAYLVNKASFATERDVAADFGSGEITFAHGDEKITITADDFQGKEADEICFADLVDRVCECFPQYKGDFYYDIESATIVPLFKDEVNAAASISLPATFAVNGEEVVVDEEMCGGNKASDIIAHLTAGFSNKDVTAYLSEREGKYYLVQKSFKGDSVSSGKKNAGAKAKKVEEKYPSTAIIYLSFNDYREQLAPEKFEGREKVTLADIIDYLKPKFAILRNEEKTKSIRVFSYDKETNQINIIVSEGKRGAAGAPFCMAEGSGFVESSMELDSILYKSPVTAFDRLICCRGKYDMYYMKHVYATMSKAFVYETTPSGKTLIGFHLKTPRIPKKVKEDMVRYFRSEMPNEAICKILYNFRTGQFSVKKPERMNADRVSVDSCFAPVIDPVTEVVATFHSHNSMPAFFSSTDDAAEMDHIGVFGVVGQLDRPMPQIVIRAVYEGSARNVAPMDFFDAL